MADLATQTPATTGTLWVWFSMTKIVPATARNYFSRPELLSAPTHARIKAAVAQTGYRPAAASPA